MEDKSTDIQSPMFEAESSNNQKRNIGLTGAFIALLFLFILGTSFVVKKTVDNKREPVTKAEKNNALGDGTVVYGYWNSNSSIIEAMDLSTGKELAIATLGKDIKHIKVTNNHAFFYLDKTDVHDYGSELVLRDIETNTNSTIIKADTNFGIDDYVISSDGKYAAVWEVGVSSQSQQFAGSPSRVYTIKVESGNKNLIYDESSKNGETVHYPIAITDDGSLFTDKFLPNSGAGWGYGMSVSDFSGHDKKDIISMENGTYSSQPIVSPDGNSFAFAGYSGKDGVTVTGGFRKALIKADTIEIFDLNTMRRRKIPANIDNALYSKLHWDDLSGNLFFQAIQKTNGGVESSTYSYNPAGNSVEKLPDISQMDFLARTGNNHFITGQKLQDDSGVGNLGPTYTQSLNKLYNADIGTLSQKSLPISQSPVQLVDILPSKYFPIVEKKGDVLTRSDQQLKLQTFEVKPTLAPRRLTQQSEPVPQPIDAPPTTPFPSCRDITYPQCNQLLGTNYSTSKDLSEIPDKAFADCMWKAQSEVSDHCEDSPLYLYGKEGTNINITIGTKISNTNVSFNNNSVKTQIGKDNHILVEGKLLNNISYDYVSKVKRFVQPVEGYITAKKDITAKIEDIALAFGFNKVETEDLINYAGKIDSPYLFISFYDQVTSQEILPLYFDPAPATYRNIVFYFKKLNFEPKIIPQRPKIVPVVRRGLTAIEISYIVR